MAEKQIRFSVEIDGAPVEQTLLQSISIHQGINAHHTFDLRLSMGMKKDSLKHKGEEWIGKQIIISYDFVEEDQIISTNLTKRFIGFVTRLGLARRTSAAELIVSGYSPTYLMDDGPRTRSFTEMKVEEVASKLTDDYAGTMKLDKIVVDPTRFTGSIPYLVQYREHNFAFLNRLANRYGEWFYYDGMKLVFGATDELEFVDLDFDSKELISFDLTLQATPVKRKVAAYDYHTNEVTTEESPGSTKTSTIGEVALKAAADNLFGDAPTVFTGTSLPAADVKPLATRQEEIMYDEVLLASGSSRAPDLKIGCVIMVVDRSTNEELGNYNVSSLHHHLTQGGDYVNHFTAYPIEVETPPLEAIPSPPFCEVQEAVVTSVDDDKAMGRVKVKFRWQEGTEEESPFIRVATPYTSKEQGFYFVPEVEDTVLVGFENNSPDHPYVLTSLYNGKEKPGYFDKKNKVKGIKTKGNNEVKFDDKSKTITISAPETLILKAGKKIVLETGEGSDTKIFIDAREGEAHIIANQTIATSTTKLQLIADDEVVTNTKKLNLNSDDQATVKSKQVKVDGGTKTDVIGGGGKVNLAAGQVKLNA
ncbi:MAG: phage baseplate assembly protein V [Bacteroidota bacterium]